MKKILLVLLLALVSAALFAGGASEDKGYHGVTDNAFMPTLSDVKGTLTRKLYYNPAELTENKLIVEVPNVSVSVFNFAKALSNRTVAEAISRFTHLQFSKKDLMAVLTGLVNNVGTGYNDLITLDVGLGVAIDNWAISLDARGMLKSMPKLTGDDEIDYTSGATLTSSGFVPMVDAALSFGYGFRALENEKGYLDLGFAARIADKVYVEQLTASKIVNDFKIDETPSRSGLAFPVDIGAVYGMERMMGRDHTPVRAMFDYGAEHFLKERPILWVLIVAAAPEGRIRTHGLFIGEGRKCLSEAVRLAQKKNIDFVERGLKKCVVYLDPEEFRSTWLGNKAIYRTRMAMADGGELIILAPGVMRFGEDAEVDRLIRRFGYRGRRHILEEFKKPENEDLRNNMGAAAHLIHGSSDGRFTVTYAVKAISREEIESVGFKSADYDEMITRCDPEKLTSGWNCVDGEAVYYIPNPALGLWINRERFES